MPYRWEDDAYPDIDDREGWTEEELRIAAGRASYARRLHRRRPPESLEHEEKHTELSVILTQSETHL